MRKIVDVAAVLSIVVGLAGCATQTVEAPVAPVPATRTQVRARHILVKTRGEAEAIRKQLLKGADFAALAKKHSMCPSKAQGGDLGFFGRGQMVAPFEQAAFTQKPMAIGDVVPTQFGFHLVQVLQVK